MFTNLSFREWLALSLLIELAISRISEQAAKNWEQWCTQLDELWDIHCDLMAVGGR